MEPQHLPAIHLAIQKTLPITLLDVPSWEFELTEASLFP
jgi:hypothetical protein